MTSTLPRPYERPSSLLLALEFSRAGLDGLSAAASWPLLRAAPPGDGHPVLVLPGWGASDVSTAVMRAFLRDRGYHAHAWRLGRNLGPTPGTVEGLRHRVGELARRHGRRMTLVGWSLGGIYVREIARAAPDLVRLVITLGSPFRLRDRMATNLGGLFKAVGARSGHASLNDPRPPEHQREALPVPATSIYTRTDGVVPWRSCLEIASPTSESVEVTSSHAGLGHNPAALWVIADRLAQPEGTWHPFRPQGMSRILFPGAPLRPTLSRRLLNVGCC